jgi:hypothetical protein
MAKLSSAELAKREDVIMKMKKNKRGLVKRYGSDAEKVMYGRATNIAKKVAETQMEKSNLKELVRAALMQEKAGFSKEFDSDPALKGGQKNLPDGLQKSIIKKEKGVKEDQRIYLFDPDKSDKGIEMGKGDPTIQKIKTAYSRIFDDHRALVNHITKTYPEVIKDQKVVTYFNDINTVLKTLKDIWQSEIKEDLDLGHEDDEPHMIKGELYRIGKYAMELYQMVDQFEGEGEVDFPAWWQSKITTAMNNMVSAKHYLDFETKEPEIDAAVDVIDASDALDNVGVDESLNEDLTSALTALIISIIAIPAVPITGALIIGLINYLFSELPNQRAEAKSLRSYKGPDKREKVLALAKEIESKLSPGKKRYLKTLVDRIGASKLEDKAKEYRELDRYVQRQKLDENLATDIESALEDLPVPTDMEEGLPKGYFKKATAELDESFEKLVGKLKKGGKSEKAAKAIAGAVASYKAKGGGKGPTAKQKARG